MALDPPAGVSVLLSVPVVVDSPHLSTGLEETLLALGRFSSSSYSGLAVEVAAVPQVVVRVAQGQ